MLHHISWTAFLTALSILLVFYYLFLFIVRYVVGRGRPSADHTQQNASLNLLQQPNPVPETLPAEFPQLLTDSEFMRQLRLYLSPYGAGELSADDLFQAVKGLLVQYPAVSQALDDDQISQLVARELEAFNILLPTAVDWRGLWMDTQQ